MNRLVPLNRRELLTRVGTGLGMLGLTGILGDECAAAQNPLAPKQPHFPAKAKHVIHLFMNGGPSHVDTFDPKPELTKQHGKALPMENLRTAQNSLEHAERSMCLFEVRL